MAPNPDAARALAAASRLRDLAVEYGTRSHDAQAALVGAFEADAEGLAADLGEIVIQDADDEHLELTSSGRFAGSVLRTSSQEDAPSDPPTWEEISSPDDVVDFYDPVDLFDDLADAIEEAFPGVVDDGDLAGDALSAAAPMSTAPWLARIAPGAGDALPAAPGARPTDGSDIGDPPPETATKTMLRDLHAAGVYTDAEFAAKMAELDEA